MKHFIVPVALALLSVIAMSAEATQQSDCNPTTISSGVLDELSQPAGNAMDSETDDARWEEARAIAERVREYSAIERRHNDHAYRVASHLIDAQYDIAQAEIAQVVLHNVRLAARDFGQARDELASALRETASQSKRRASVAALRDQLQRTDLGTTLCHGQSRGEDRYQYERLKASIRRVIGTL